MTLAAIIQGSDLNDGETTLAGRFAAGEAGAFEEVVNLYQAKVARLARRLLGWDGDTEDLVQDVFLAALTGAGRFRRDASLWTWLSTITVNRCRNRARHVAVIRRFRSWFNVKQSETAVSADAEAIADERCHLVRQAVARLPALEREAVVLFYLEGRSIGELSEILSATPNTVSVRLHRAREKLAAALQPLIEDEMT